MGGCLCRGCWLSLFIVISVSVVYIRSQWRPNRLSLLPLHLPQVRSQAADVVGRLLSRKPLRNLDHEVKFKSLTGHWSFFAYGFSLEHNHDSHHIVCRALCYLIWRLFTLSHSLSLKFCLYAGWCWIWKRGGQSQTVSNYRWSVCLFA